MLNIPAGYRKTLPYSESRLVRTYVPTSSTFALVLVADELLRENVVDDVRGQNQENTMGRSPARGKMDEHLDDNASRSNQI